MSESAKGGIFLPPLRIWSVDLGGSPNLVLVDVCQAAELSWCLRGRLHGSGRIPYREREPRQPFHPPGSWNLRAPGMGRTAIMEARRECSAALRTVPSARRIRIFTDFIFALRGEAVLNLPVGWGSRSNLGWNGECRLSLCQPASDRIGTAQPALCARAGACGELRQSAGDCVRA